MIVNLTNQPLAQDIYAAITWANNNLGQTYTIQFPNGQLNLILNNPIAPPIPSPPLPDTGGFDTPPPVSNPGPLPEGIVNG